MSLAWADATSRAFGRRERTGNRAAEYLSWSFPQNECKIKAAMELAITA
jgi:hypothetical protein